MAASLIILVTIAFSCSALTGSEKTPEITNANDNFVTIGDISLSNEEVYQTLIWVDCADDCVADKEVK